MIPPLIFGSGPGGGLPLGWSPKTPLPVPLHLGDRTVGDTHGNADHVDQDFLLCYRVVGTPASTVFEVQATRTVTGDAGLALVQPPPSNRRREDRQGGARQDGAELPLAVVGEPIAGEDFPIWADGQGASQAVIKGAYDTVLSRDSLGHQVERRNSQSAEVGMISIEQPYQQVSILLR